jgi:hypothetical protein
MTRRITTILLLIGVAAMAIASAGSADTYKSHDEAQAAGDPAASAPSAPVESTFLYRGKEIAVNDAAALDLACIQNAGQRTRCYSTGAELDRAEGVANPAQKDAARVARKHKNKRRHRAHRAQHYYYPMQLWEHTFQHGWRLDLNSQCAWYNIPGAYNDNASSYDVGNHSGHLSQDYGGLGPWYPGPTGAYAVGNMTDYVGWNDWVSSRYRLGC